jgi:hypothetical protein
MRALTEQTRALIEELRSLPKRRFGFVRARTAAAVELLGKIANAAELAALPEILSLVLEKDAPVAQAAARTTAVLLATVPTTKLPWIDEWLRERSSWLGGWWGIAPRDVKDFDRFGETAGALFQLATMHPIGFVREEAIRILSARSAAGSIPYLLIRRNDWVPQVRAVASEALDRCLMPENAEQIVEALPLVHRLRTCYRADHKPFIDRVNTLLRQPSSEAALISGLGSADPGVRRSCFSFALEVPGPRQAELLRSGLDDHDPIVRLTAARSALRAAPVDLAELLDRMERDSYAPVRQAGLDARISLFPSDAESTYQRHLLDRSISIRSQCQRALKGTRCPPEVIYREEIQSGRTRSLDIALFGLSEVGGADDAKLASGFLAHELARVRAAAVRAVSRLETCDVKAVLYAALRDRSPRVSREARTALLTRRVYADPDELRDTLQRSEYHHARINAVSVADTLPRWTRLQFLLRACVNPDERLVARAVLGISRWLATSNRAAMSPTADEVRDTSQLLASATNRLPDETATELTFVLRTIS